MKTASPGEERVTFEDREGGFSLLSLAGGRGCGLQGRWHSMPNRKPSGEDRTQEAEGEAAGPGKSDVPKPEGR